MYQQLPVLNFKSLCMFIKIYRGINNISRLNRYWPNMTAYKIVEGDIPIGIYQWLRVECGLSAKTDEACSIGLANSVYSVMVELEGETIGMGRIVGDGGCFCQVVDICVLPNHQGKGFGKIIMQRLSNYISRELPASCYVSLIADGDASFLYEQFGFKDTLPKSKGMFLKK